MYKRQIHNDAILIVDRSIEPTDGKIVIASVDGSYTCKRLQLYPEPRLVAENIKYPPIKIDKKEDFEIIGVVLAAINQF